MPVRLLKEELNGRKMYDGCDLNSNNPLIPFGLKVVVEKCI